MTSEDRDQKVTELIEDLGLSKVADNKVLLSFFIPYFIMQSCQKGPKSYQPHILTSSLTENVPLSYWLRGAKQSPRNSTIFGLLDREAGNYTLTIAHNKLHQWTL